MKTARLLVCGICLVWTLSGCASVELESLEDSDSGLIVATLNVHYLSSRVPEMQWTIREDAVVSVLSEIGADIVAFQEMETFGGGRFNAENIQLESLQEAFPQYGFAAVGDPRSYPSTQPIAYRTGEIEPVEQGFFFFSSDPDTIYARPWHKRFPAFASWVWFRRTTTGQTFYVFNIHADASSPRNRMKTARLVVKRISNRTHAEDPVILLGDFNAPSFFPSLGIYRRAGLVRAGSGGSTYHFNRGRHLIPGIDHVMAKGVAVSDAVIVRRQYDGVWPSDHYPVAARVDGF